MKTTALCLAAQLAFAMSAAMPSMAQETADETADETPAAEPDAPEIDWSRINIDALGLMQDRPQTGSVPRMPTPADAATWNRSENKNGSANVAQKQSWSNGISTNVGVNSVDGAGAQQGWPKPGAAQVPSSGTAWANAAVPGVGLVDQTTLDARVDPDGDQRKFGARFEKSIPLNPQFSVTLQNGYGLSQPLANQTIAGAPPPAHVFDSEQSAKLNVLNYGTSLFAGSKQSSTDERRLNSFGAEQNFLGGLSVSGSVNENTNGGHDRSLTARFRKSW